MLSNCFVKDVHCRYMLVTEPDCFEFFEGWQGLPIKCLILYIVPALLFKLVDKHIVLMSLFILFLLFHVNSSLELNFPKL